MHAADGPANRFYAHVRGTGHMTLEVFITDRYSCEVFRDFTASLSMEEADQLLAGAGFRRDSRWQAESEGGFWALAVYQRLQGLFSCIRMRLMDIGELREALLTFTDLKGAWGASMHESKEVLLRADGRVFRLARVAASFYEGSFVIMLDGED